MIHTIPTNTVPKQIEMVVDEVRRALLSGDVVAATDGGYDPETECLPERGVGGQDLDG